MNIDTTPAPRPVPPRRAAADERMLMDAATGPRQRRVPRPILAGTLVLCLAGAAAAGVLVVGSEEASVTDQVRCHSNRSLGDGTDFPGTSVAMAGPDGEGPVPITDAIAACTNLWDQGVLRAGVDNAQSPGSLGQPVPPLTACVDPDGIAAVFPTDRAGFCGSLGLKALQP